LPGTASFGLAVAVGLAQQLEALGLAVQLKWPNDLLVGDRKIAGLLPRLRLRGQRIRAAQVGVGLNGCNRVPPGALSVAQALGCRKGHPQARPERLLPRVLAGLEWAAAHANQPYQVRAAAEALLWRPGAGWLHDGELWQVLGLHVDGRLRLGRQGRELDLRRYF
jgi:BirA family biotin operon repressor/biotin-[acetyl-CoA-carboxylase] ligase